MFKTVDVLLCTGVRPGLQLSRLVGASFLRQLPLVVAILARLLQQVSSFSEDRSRELFLYIFFNLTCKFLVVLPSVRGLHYPLVRTFWSSLVTGFLQSLSVSSCALSILEHPAYVYESERTGLAPNRLLGLRHAPALQVADIQLRFLHRAYVFPDFFSSFSYFSMF